MGSIFFASAFLLCFLSAAAISVYGYGFVEPAWGSAISFQVLTWMSLAGTLLATLVHAAGLVLFRRLASRWHYFGHGFLSALVCMGLLSLPLGAGSNARFAIAMAAVMGSALLASAVAPRHGA